MKKIISLVILFAVLFCAAGCSASNRSSDVPEGMKLIEPKTGDYNLYIPEAWKPDLTTGITTAYVSDTDPSNISVMAVSLKGEDISMSLDDYWNKTYDEFKSTFGSDFEYTSQKTLFGGVEANRYEYTAEVTGTEYHYLQVMCLRHDTLLYTDMSYVYIFTFTAEGENYEKNIEDVESILTEFTFN